MRPTIEDVERYLDELDYIRATVRRLLEDIYNVEDGPETDAMIRRTP